MSNAQTPNVEHESYQMWKMHFANQNKTHEVCLAKCRLNGLMPFGYFNQFNECFALLCFAFALHCNQPNQIELDFPLNAMDSEWKQNAKDSEWKQNGHKKVLIKIITCVSQLPVSNKKTDWKSDTLPVESGIESGIEMSTKTWQHGVRIK